MRGLTIIIAALICVVVSAGSLVAVRPAGADQPPQSSSGDVFSEASAGWASWDRGIYTLFFFTAGDYKSRVNSLPPGDRAALLWENVYFSFIQIDTSHNTVLREMAGGSGSADGGRLFVTADHATLKATLPIRECLPSAGVVGSNCTTRTLDLDLELTRDGSPDLTHQSYHRIEPCPHTNISSNVQAVPALATGQITVDDEELTSDLPGTGEIRHGSESFVQLGPCTGLPD